MRIIQFINYVTQIGDTFDRLALTYLGDDNKANMIMDQNLDYIDVLIFDENVTIRIPVYEDTTNVESALPPWRKHQ